MNYLHKYFIIATTRLHFPGKQLSLPLKKTFSAVCEEVVSLMADFAIETVPTDDQDSVGVDSQICNYVWSPLLQEK